MGECPKRLLIRLVDGHPMTLARVMGMDFPDFEGSLPLVNPLGNTSIFIRQVQRQRRESMRAASNTRSGGPTIKKVCCFTSTFTSTASFAGSMVRKWTGDAMAN